MSANRYADQKFASVARPKSRAAGSVATTEVDTAGADIVEYFVYCGTAANLDITTMQVTHSDTSGSSHANISGALLSDQDADQKQFMIRVRKGGVGKQYFDLTLTTGSATAVIAVFALLKGLDSHPPAAADDGLDNFVDIGAS